MGNYCQAERPHSPTSIQRPSHFTPPPYTHQPCGRAASSCKTGLFLSSAAPRTCAHDQPRQGCLQCLGHRLLVFGTLWAGRGRPSTAPCQHGFFSFSFKTACEMPARCDARATALRAVCLGAASSSTTKACANGASTPTLAPTPVANARPSSGSSACSTARAAFSMSPPPARSNASRSSATHLRR